MLLLLGSGKTAVLVERIINKIIVEKIDIDKLLVVTFTNAAAAEMRERVLDAIYKKLEEDPENENLQRQVTLLNKASICTIDSFCLEVVRNNFFELDNLSPNFRIGDTTEIELLKQEVIEEIFEQKYEEENDNFTKLINIYTSYRDDTPLKDLVLKIYSYIQSNPFPEKWLKEKIEMFDLSEKLDEDFSNTPWGEVLLQEVEEELIDDISTLEKVEEDLSFEPELDKFQQTIRSDIEQLEVLKRNLANWDKSCEIAKNISFVSWPRQKVESELKEFSKKIAIYFFGLVKSYSKIAFTPADEHIELPNIFKQLFQLLDLATISSILAKSAPFATTDITYVDNAYVYLSSIISRSNVALDFIEEFYQGQEVKEEDVNSNK